MKNILPKQAEENLRRAASRRPTHVHHRNRKQQRNTCHVCKSLAKLAGRMMFPPRGAVSLECGVRCPQTRYARRGEEEGERVQHERPLVTELTDRNPRQKTSQGQSHPLRRLRQC